MQSKKTYIYIYLLVIEKEWQTLCWKILLSNQTYPKDDGFWIFQRGSAEAFFFPFNRLRLFV